MKFLEKMYDEASPSSTYYSHAGTISTAHISSLLDMATSSASFLMGNVKTSFSVIWKADHPARITHYLLIGDMAANGE